MATSAKYRGLKITLSENNIHIEDSYRITDKDTMRKVFRYLRKNYACNKVLSNRTDDELVRGWVAHNRLYRLGIEKERTRSVALDYPQPLKYRIAYAILGI